MQKLRAKITYKDYISYLQKFAFINERNINWKNGKR